MNNETFGITFQSAICEIYKLDNDISSERIDAELLNQFKDSKVIQKIFRGRKPVEYLSNSKKYTSQLIKRCPHNFLLANNETFSVRTFKSVGKMFAPKVVGQAGDETFNYFFGHLSSEHITRANFKDFCLAHVDEMLPIIVDYALVSDYDYWIYLEGDNPIFQTLKIDANYNLDCFFLN